MKPPAQFPYAINTEKEAAALGVAMHMVLHFDVDWVSSVFAGDSKLCYQTGPEVIRAELQDQWQHFLTDDEKRRIMAIFLEERLKMIPPPIITSADALVDYLRAVQFVTGVWQAEANTKNLKSANYHIARMWPLTFSSDQQLAIINDFTARRLAQ